MGQGPGKAVGRSGASAHGEDGQGRGAPQEERFGEL